MALSYTPYYPGGWQSGEQGGTPITPAALNNMEAGIGQATGIFGMFAMTANEKITVTALTGYGSITDISITVDGLYAFDTSNSGSGAVNLILDIRSQNSATIWHNTYMNAPQYATIQSPPMYLIAGTYKLRATGDTSQMYRYEYRA